MSQRAVRGFSLLELLVVIAIIGLLTALLVPALAVARQQGRGVVCRSNLRQMMIACKVYTQDNDGYFPIAYCYQISDALVVSYAWDFTSIKNWDAGTEEVNPGVLWQGETNERIQQCPSFGGEANWLNDPYTGYNYNTSHIGGFGSGAAFVPSARESEVRMPAAVAIFGDGGFESGANKFMRSPWPTPRDGFAERYAGTQHYRHLGRTNVGWCDGSASSTESLFRETDPASVALIAEDTGFLSADNSAYDPR
ncbi:MAG TPA: type II secretion system protein [Anaerohalosphaeraceae bacterium]|jgi:prepilin-type N-terminal cleavage/methylation domain-containing protein/prepilin-type processing-associated H-X9-DG protein|nr:type II secretion system protein [Anaerohalosphaeraceae bacterium]HRT51699.1 type II secretion system protein [Anaerohalosphaeraceae bacterium]HRT87723.1 type II secretion system protein [Anaerohalosphaeraceae bacterium]